MELKSSWEGSPPLPPPPSQELWDLLAHGEMIDCRLSPVASNYTFYSTLTDGSSRRCQVVYKPRRGEAPLWDFPDGTLYLREYATYLLSEALGWRFVPPTLIRDGVYGIGSVQLYVESNYQANYFTLRDAHRQECLRICTFDIIANNADRKASHCLLGTDACVWVIDHGITFHNQPKLRTVIWDFVGDPVPEWILTDLRRLLERFEASGGLRDQLTPLLASQEVEALQYRVEALLERPVFPAPGRRRAVPWPWM